MQRILTIMLLLTLSLAGCSRKEPLQVIPETPDLLNSSFGLTREDLPEMTLGLPQEVSSAIEARPAYFLDLLLPVLDGNPELTRLVNKETGLGPEEEPDDLVDLNNYSDHLSLSRSGHRLRNILIPSLLMMTEEASGLGIVLMISSAYRSYSYQENLYNRYAARDGQEAADRYSARPGKSQHQLGTAIDFGSIDDSFALTEAGRWLKENAWKFGFSLSYPEGMEDYTGYVWESWHYRYIGRDAALLEEEFFGGVQERMLRFIKEKGDLFRAARLKD